MGWLFLDPFVLGTLLLIAGIALGVARGAGPRWFGHDAWWTVLLWPAPLVILALPVWAGAGTSITRLVPGLEDQGILGGAVYALAVLGPTVWLLGWPPRWLLPRWARRRIVAPPTWTRADLPDHAVPAVQARRGHGSLSAWAWQVDGVAGHVWLDPDATRLHFRGLDAPGVIEPATGAVEAATGDASDASDPRGPGRGVDDPLGGRWQRGVLDVELTELDGVTRLARGRRRHAGVIRFEVDGRRPTHLWLADADRVLAAIEHRR